MFSPSTMFFKKILPVKTWKTDFKSCRTGPNPAQIQFQFLKNLTPHDFSIMTRSWFETALVYKPRKICKFLYFIGFSSLERSTFTSSFKVLFVWHYKSRWCYEKWIKTKAGGKRSIYFSRMAQEIWYCLEWKQCYCYLQAKSLYISRTVSNFYEKKMKFGLVLGRLTILKKKLDRLWTTCEVGFFMFLGAKKIDFFL